MSSETTLSLPLTLASLAVILELLATGSYIRAVLRREICPSRASWLIWALLEWLTVASTVEGGGGLAVAKLAAGALGTSVICLLALGYGTGGRSRTDVGCFALTLVGIGLWAVLGDPLLALGVFLLADLTGAVPTLLTTWRSPTSERTQPWLLHLIATVAILLTVPAPAWTAGAAGFASWAAPLYLLLLYGLIVALTLRRPARLALA